MAAGRGLQTHCQFLRQISRDEVVGADPSGRLLVRQQKTAFLSWKKKKKEKEKEKRKR
jgi:hypothetical protein